MRDFTILYAPTDTLPQSLRIFIVENHPDTLKSLQTYLEGLGHSVATARTLEQALDQLPNSHSHVLISDIGLPDGTGWDLLRRADLPRDIFAIATSGFGRRADCSQSRAADFRHHLLKPFDLDELDRILDEAASTFDLNPPVDVQAR